VSRRPQKPHPAGRRTCDADRKNVGVTDALADARHLLIATVERGIGRPVTCRRLSAQQSGLDHIASGMRPDRVRELQLRE
jgi:hypothetical protein